MTGALGQATGIGRGQGFGTGHGVLGGSHRTRASRISIGTTEVSGGIAVEVIRRIVRQNFGRFRLCYETALQASPAAQGRVVVRFTIGRDGGVSRVQKVHDPSLPAAAAACIARAFYGLSFPAPESGLSVVTYPLVFSPSGQSPESAPRPPLEFPQAAAIENPTAEAATNEVGTVPVKGATRDPYTGEFKTVKDLLDAGSPKAAIDAAFSWHHKSPGDVLALVALGEALEAKGEVRTAARAYGSLIDLFPGRADLRRFAGARLERLKGSAGLDLALDTFDKAEKNRPDHPASHRLLGIAELKKGRYSEALSAIARGLRQEYPAGRFAGAKQILAEDLGLVAAAWIKAEPQRRDEILTRLHDAGGVAESEPSLRFVLNWETDANDVDFHITDATGEHAYYQHPRLSSGGVLYADVTTGYGPECFTVRLPREKRSERYHLQVHYYSRGPMGYGMGKVEVIDHDGKGGITFDERPFTVMEDHAFVDLGVVKR